eukprot:gene15672-21779_t
MPVTSSVSEIADALEEALDESDAQILPSFVLEDTNRSNFLQQFRLLHQLALSARQRLPPVEDPCPVNFDIFGSGVARLYDSTSPPTSTSAEEEESLQEPSLSVRELKIPGPCSFLSPGQSFYGSQRMSSSLGRAAEDWEVVVKIQSVVPSSGYVCGLMEARNVPNARAPITTFWEGEIVDNINHTFFTHKFGALHDTDLLHWRKFSGFNDLAVQRDGRSTALESCGSIYMRWKETFFVDPSESCMLTIQGFYYIMMDRQSGVINGFYYDPNSTPFQRLSLRPFSSAGASNCAAN